MADSPQPPRPPRPPRRHTVLHETDSAAFGSLKVAGTPRSERYALGRALREQVPRSSLATWSPPPDRRPIPDQVAEANEGRVEALVPIRVGRMIASPYAFLRGAAAIHAEDFARLPATGITPVVCGDAHLGNFGFYASPERQLVFDLNDFDEAHPGGWEWDLRRLTTSVWVAGRQNGSSERECRLAAEQCVREYRRHVRYLSDQPLLRRSFERFDVERMRETAIHGKLHQEIQRAAERARRRTGDHAVPRFTGEEDGRRRIVADPPVLTPPTEQEYDEIVAALDGYLATLPLHWSRVVGGYRVVDVAHKVVGVGSVGLRAWVALCEGSSPEDVLFLQLKQARRSVVARFVHGDDAWHAHQGQRVVEYQQALQTVSDPLLGWTEAGGVQYYVRQFRDMKGAITVEGIKPGALRDYAGICGHLLAKGHARTSGASMIAGYLGKGPNAEEALADFAKAYADQTELDHQALVDAVRRGDLPAETGV